MATSLDLRETLSNFSYLFSPMILAFRRWRNEEVLSRAGWRSAALVVAGSARMPQPRQSNDDPFQWLEDVQGEKALAWAKEHNAKSTALLEARPEYKPIYTRTLEILDSKEKIPTPELLGETVYNFWKDDAHERGIWRRTTLASYRTADAAVGDGARRGRAREGGRQGLGLPRRGLSRRPLTCGAWSASRPAARTPPCSASSTRRRSSSCPAGSPCRRPSRTSRGGTRTRSGSARTSAPAR